MPIRYSLSYKEREVWHAFTHSSSLQIFIDTEYVKKYLQTAKKWHIEMNLVPDFKALKSLMVESKTYL